MAVVHEAAVEVDAPREAGIGGVECAPTWLAVVGTEYVGSSGNSRYEISGGSFCLSR